LSQELLSRAREYAFLLLKFRQRSCQEIRQRLRKKKFPEEVIKMTVAFLEERRFLDDQEFARAWLSSRLKKPYGLRRIREELRMKGVSGPIIDELMSDGLGDYSEDKIVLMLARKKFAQLKKIEPKKARQRVFAFLLRRGFGPDISVEALNKLSEDEVRPA
jgi:regulatory protein